MNFVARSLVVVISLVVLSGCTGASNDDYNYAKERPKIETDFKKYGANVFLKSFSDHRQGTALVLPSSNNVIYAYDPVKLTNGRLMPILGYHIYNDLALQDNQSPHSIGVDVSIRNVRSLIRHGALNHLGYYWVEAQARIILTDVKSGEVIDAFPLVLSFSKARTTTTGRQPSTQEDRKAMLKLMDKLAVNISQEVIDVSTPIIKRYVQQQDSVEDQVDEYIEEVDQSYDIPEVQANEIVLPPELLQQIESEEARLIQRKEQQQNLFEQKVQEQQYIDSLNK